MNTISLWEDFSQTQEFLENIQVKDDNDGLKNDDKNCDIMEENWDNEDEIITKLNEENDNDWNNKEDWDDMNIIGIKLNEENSENTENTEEQKDIEEFPLLSTDIEKEWKTFYWWYTTSWFNEWSEITIWRTLSTWDYLYTKQEDCPEGYILNEVTRKCIMTAAEQKRQQIVEDLDVYMLWSDTDKNHYTLMDRNMWATGIYNNNYSNPNINSLWYYYQWWNNYWFDSKADNPGNLNNITGNTVDVSSYSWSNPYESYWFVGKDSNSKNWMKSVNKNLWWWEESDVSHRQWPCPDWYHVPSVDEWRWLVTSYSNVINGWLKLSRYLLLPAAWYRDRWFWTVGSINWNWNYVYASSSLNWSDISKRIVYTLVSVWDGDLKVSNSQDNNPKHEWSANGISVRCLKNEVNTWATAIDKNDIHLRWWTKAIISMLSSWEVIAIQNPTRASGTFSGWYTNNEFLWDKITLWSVVEPWTSLYAKWECPLWQVDNGIKCTTNYTVTFDANGGSVSTGEMIVIPGYTYTDLPVPTRSGYIYNGWYANFNGTNDYVNYGRDYMYTDKISVHLSVYMDNWSNYSNNSKRIISSTEVGWWNIESPNGKIQFSIYDLNVWYKSFSTSVAWNTLTPWWHERNQSWWKIFQMKDKRCNYSEFYWINNFMRSLQYYRSSKSRYYSTCRMATNWIQHKLYVNRLSKFWKSKSK